MNSIDTTHLPVDTSIDKTDLLVNTSIDKLQIFLFSLTNLSSVNKTPDRQTIYIQDASDGRNCHLFI